MKRLPLVLILSLVALPLFAWGEKGHYLVNEAATMAAPTDMPHFFYRAFPQLVWSAYSPDRWKGTGESLDAINPPEHFLDYEFVAGLQLPRDRFKFIDLLYTSKTLRQHGLSNSTAGFLPWRIAELCDRLTNEWRQWRLSAPGSSERAFIERDIIRDAGVLGHFAGDAANPHHTTLNFNGWVTPNPNGYAIDCDTHGRFESVYVTHSIATADVAPRVAKRPTLRTDYFAAAMDMVRESNSQVEQLYILDREGGFDIFKPRNDQAFAFASSRLAAGAGLLRDLWWSTWQASAKPPKRRSSED